MRIWRSCTLNTVQWARAKRRRRSLQNIITKSAGCASGSSSLPPTGATENSRCVRIGLTAQCEAIGPECDLREQYAAHGRADVIIVDECQFLTGQQIDQLRELVDRENLPVLCFGLRTDFQTKLFPGSRRLFELADSITEIKTICDCGRKATTNARISPDGYVVTEGDQVFLGGNDSYIAMCHKCYQDYINEHRKVELLHGTERDPQ